MVNFYDLPFNDVLKIGFFCIKKERLCLTQGVPRNFYKWIQIAENKIVIGNLFH